MIIRSLTEADRAAWDRFVLSSGKGTFFHLSGWEMVLKKAFGHRTHFMLADSGGEVVGVLPLAEVKSRLFGHRLISVPFCVYGGPVGVQDDVEVQLLESACELARELRVDDLEIRSRGEAITDWPVQDLYFTFRKEIDPDPDVNMKAIPRKQRAMVRKGIQAGLSGELEDGIDRFYPIYAESVRNLGTPVYSRRYFRMLREVFGDACSVLVIEHEGQDIAAVMSFRFRDEILPYYGGSRPAARALKGNDFMYWELMNRAAQEGVRLFDFGRSKRDTGPFSFKRNWGFEPEQLFYQHFLVEADEIPSVNPTNPKYQALIRTWQSLPLPVTNTLGPFISRSLG